MPFFPPKKIDFQLRAILAALVFAVLLVSGGCVPGERDGRTTILYAFWGSVEQQALERKVVEMFEAENPDIRVKMLPIGARYSDKLQAMFVGNVAPDVMMLGLAHYWDWSQRGLLEPMDEIMTPERAEGLMPAVRKAFSKDGRFYAAPVHAGGHVMFLNLNALRAAGVDPDSLKTWDDVLAAAPALAKRGGGSGNITEYAYMVPQALSLIWSFGGRLFDDLFDPTEVTIESPETLAAFRFIRALHANPHSVPFDALNDQGGFTLFRDGKIAVYFNGRWVTPEFFGIEDFEWDVRPIPAAGGGEVSHLFGSALGVWSGSRHKDAARRFVDFYTSGKGMDVLIEGGRYTPVDRDLAYGEKFLSFRPPESMVGFSRTMEEGKSEYPLYALGSLRIGELVRGRIEQLYSQPGIPEEQVLAGLKQDLEDWLARQKKLRRSTRAAE